MENAIEILGNVGAGINVLVLDESVMVGKPLKKYLQPYEAFVTEADYFKRAFLIMEKFRIDVIFIDRACPK